MVTVCLLEGAPANQGARACAARECSQREGLELALRASGGEIYRRDSLQSPGRRGLKGVRPVPSAVYEGLRAAMDQILVGLTCQRCRIHFVCSLLPHVAPRDKARAIPALTPWPPNRRDSGSPHTHAQARLSISHRFACRPLSFAAGLIPVTTRTTSTGSRRASITWFRQARRRQASANRRRPLT